MWGESERAVSSNDDRTPPTTHTLTDLISYKYTQSFRVLCKKCLTYMFDRCKIDVYLERRLLMKVQVNISDDMVARIDEIAKTYGVSRSALCSVFIGQAVASTERAFDAVSEVGKNILKGSEKKA